MKEMEKIRARIDLIDDSIVELLDERLKLSKELSKSKLMILDLKRESEIIERLSKKTNVRIGVQYIRMVYSVIFTIMKEEMKNVS